MEYFNDEGTIPVAGISPPLVTCSTICLLSIAKANAFLTLTSFVGSTSTLNIPKYVPTLGAILKLGSSALSLGISSCGSC